MTPPHERATLFNDEAERYDRIRPSYPDELIEDVLGPSASGLKVLDIASGTGKASRQIATSGADVLGVELNAGMAEIAVRHGIPTEISSFESWDPLDRTFDVVTCAQAWHWLDPKISIDKVAAITRSGSRLCVFWNIGKFPDDLADAMQQTYERVLDPDSPIVIGYAANRDAHPIADFSIVAETLGERAEFAEPATKSFPWTRVYPKDQWIDEVSSHSDHIALPLEVRRELFEEIGRTIDSYGGSFAMEYLAVLICASRL